MVGFVQAAFGRRLERSSISDAGKQMPAIATKQAEYQIAAERSRMGRLPVFVVAEPALPVCLQKVGRAVVERLVKSCQQACLRSLRIEFLAAFRCAPHGIKGSGLQGQFGQLSEGHQAQAHPEEGNSPVGFAAGLIASQHPERRASGMVVISEVDEAHLCPQIPALVLIETVGHSQCLVETGETVAVGNAGGVELRLVLFVGTPERDHRVGQADFYPFLVEDDGRDAGVDVSAFFSFDDLGGQGRRICRHE